MLPNFVILGAQKSASTHLHRCLAQHPEIYMAPGETRFFEDPEYLSAEVADLEKAFVGVEKEKALGIRRPDYLAKPEVPARVAKLLPQAQLIAILRNPIDRALSAYYYYIKLGFLPVVPVEVGMEAVLQGTVTRTHPKAGEILDYGLYFHHLTKYLELFDRQSLLLLRLEELVQDGPEALRKVFRFLDVDPTFVCGSLGKQQNPGVYSLARLKLLRLRNRYMYTYNANKTKLYPRRLSAFGYVVAGGITLLDRFALSRVLGNKRPIPSSGLRERLVAYYERDLLGLESLLDIDLSEWRR